MEATLTKRLTYSDYVQMTPPDSGKFQLIEGELVVRTSPIFIFCLVFYFVTQKKKSLAKINY
jgi:hypothetical protein